MCSKCLQAFCAKFIYSCIIIVIFGIIALTTFDTYYSLENIQYDKFELTQSTTNLTELIPTQLQTNLLGIPYLSDIFSDDQYCLSFNETQQACYFLKNENQTSKGKQLMQNIGIIFSVKAATLAFIESDKNKNMCKISLLLAITSTTIGCVIAICIILCCTGWCKCCCCCKAKKYVQMQEKIA
uniref:Transmembrane domain-containing protein n=1 Tax=Trepomonas sp. PC1 TaxID=1076344 RepID=A0A146K3V7_9EUKA|eukprot:JAP91600.1 Transmembrane domain-containing protein [Trepomonas sp. PC1]